MKSTAVYIDSNGRRFMPGEFDAEERDLISDLLAYSGKNRDWSAYSNYWMPRVREFYESRGMGRRDIRESNVFHIAQDIDGRLAIEAGLARLPDYRDELEGIIRERFPTRRAFCEATGLSEDMLSHVLAKRKHLAVDTLAEALGRIGYAVRLVPMEEAPR